MPTYTHNDYYGYINKVQEKAISNPEWFWSDAASEARQWLYDNNAGKIVEEIYNNTPDEIKSRIDPKMFPTQQQTNQFVDKIHEGQNEFLDNAGAIGLQSAGIMGLGIGAAFNPIGTAGAFIGGSSASRVLDGAINKYFNGKYKDWGALLRRNKNWGQTGNMFANMTNPFGLLYGGAGYAFGTKFNASKSLFQTPEIWTRGMSRKARADYSRWLDNIQTYKNRNYPVGSESIHLNGADIGIDPQLHFKIASDQFSPFNIEYLSTQQKGELAGRVNWSYDQAQRVLDFYRTHSKNPNSKGIILEDFPIARSFNRDGTSHVGIAPDVRRPIEYWHDDNSGFTTSLPYAETVGHELEHNNWKLNTRLTQDIWNNMSDNEKALVWKESPFYGNDYGWVPQWYKNILKPFGKRSFRLFKRKPSIAEDEVAVLPEYDVVKKPIGYVEQRTVNPHDIEFNEQHSDAFGTRTQMNLMGIGKDGKITPWDVLRFRFTPYGWKNRFMLHHPGLRNQANILNKSSELKQGGKLNG